MTVFHMKGTMRMKGRIWKTESPISKSSKFRESVSSERGREIRVEKDERAI